MCGSLKAFDVIQHDLLLAKLKANEVGEGSCALLKRLLVRKAAASKDWTDTRRGVLQSLNMFINDLFSHIKYAKLNAYANDHQIYSSYRDHHALEDMF